MHRARGMTVVTALYGILQFQYPTLQPVLLVVLVPSRSNSFYCHAFHPLTIASQPFFGAMGCTASIVFACFGAAYGTAKAGVGISAMGVLRPDLIVKSMILFLYNFFGAPYSHLMQTLCPSSWRVSSVSTASSCPCSSLLV